MSETQKEQIALEKYDNFLDWLRGTGNKIAINHKTSQRIISKFYNG